MWLHVRVAGIIGAFGLLGGAAGLSAGPARAQGAVLQQGGLPPASLGGPCLISGHAYLRAHIRGAVRLDLAMLGPQLACEGGPRTDGSGLLMAFEGRVGPAGRRVRMIFGIDGAKEGRPGRELPTNLTVIFEGDRQIFATQGDGNCTVDRLTQKAIGAARSPARAYRVVAHGFCIAPANDVSGHTRILVTTFDFAGRADFAPP
jgi:hypothetical protein